MDRSYDMISNAVKEQLGIEEDDDRYDQLSVEQLKHQVSQLESSLDQRASYIRELEGKLSRTKERLNQLEREFYRYKR